MDISSLFKSITETTGWEPVVSAQGVNTVELDGVVLEYFSPDGANFVLRAKIQSLPDDEQECKDKCAYYAHLNAAMIKFEPNAIVIDENSFFLQAVVLNSEIDAVDVEELFENFLNDYDWIKSTQSDSSTSQSNMQFMF